MVARAARSNDVVAAAAVQDVVCAVAAGDRVVAVAAVDRDVRMAVVDDVVARVVAVDRDVPCCLGTDDDYVGAARVAAELIAVDVGAALAVVEQRVHAAAAVHVHV